MLRVIEGSRAPPQDTYGPLPHSGDSQRRLNRVTPSPPVGHALYESDAVLQLLRLLQEATRASPRGTDENYIPPTGGEIAEANYHHFVFGQRGSGKSSLLRHLQRQMGSAKRASIWIDQEIFSNLQYPDVLVSAVYELMFGILSALRQDIVAAKRTLLQKILRQPPNLTKEQQIVADLGTAVAELQKLKFAPLDRKVEWVVSAENSVNSGISGGIKFEVLSAQSERQSARTTAATTTEVIEGSKEQYLERALTMFRDLLVRSLQQIDGGFIFVDDLYQIRRTDQPLVLGYLHRLTKDTGLWLKIGSIRYSTITFKPGDPPRGMQVGHDAHEVALDRGLRHFQSTQEFLEKILIQIANTTNVDIRTLFTEDARKRLVLAAGGVARDYLRLTSGAINEARNRGVTSKPGSHRIIVEDVNKAAGQLSPSKFEDLRKDEPEEAASLEKLVRILTEFCRETKAAYFLVATDNAVIGEQVNKLQHLRFTHLLAESETVPNEGSKRFNVWFLDVAELSAQRATVGMDFLGWENREKRRNRKLIFTGEYTPKPKVVAKPKARTESNQPTGDIPDGSTGQISPT